MDRRLQPAKIAPASPLDFLPKKELARPAAPHNTELTEKVCPHELCGRGHCTLILITWPVGLLAVPKQSMYTGHNGEGEEGEGEGDQLE